MEARFQRLKKAEKLIQFLESQRSPDIDDLDSSTLNSLQQKIQIHAVNARIVIQQSRRELKAMRKVIDFNPVMNTLTESLHEFADRVKNQENEGMTKQKRKGKSALSGSKFFKKSYPQKVRNLRTKRRDDIFSDEEPWLKSAELSIDLDVERKANTIKQISKAPHSGKWSERDSVRRLHVTPKSISEFVDRKSGKKKQQILDFVIPDEPWLEDSNPSDDVDERAMFEVDIVEKEEVKFVPKCAKPQEQEALDESLLRQTRSVSLDVGPTEVSNHSVLEISELKTINITNPEKVSQSIKKVKNLKVPMKDQILAEDPPKRDRVVKKRKRRKKKASKKSSQRRKSWNIGEYQWESKPQRAKVVRDEVSSLKDGTNGEKENKYEPRVERVSLFSKSVMDKVRMFNDGDLYQNVKVEMGENPNSTPSAGEDIASSPLNDVSKVDKSPERMVPPFGLILQMSESEEPSHPKFVRKGESWRKQSFSLPWGQFPESFLN